MTKYILVEVIERNISIPEICNTHDEAYNKMRKYFIAAMGMDDEDFEEDDEYAISNNEAYCENANHDNCDWRIFEIEI